MSNILVVAAHPDDEVLGCGCAILAHKEKGDTVSVLYMTNDAKGRYPDDPSMLQRDLQKVQKMLGIDNLIQRHFTDQGLDGYKLTMLITQVEQAVREHKIDTVYTHFSNDLNKDHRLVSEATIVACRPVPGSTITKLLMYWVPSYSELRSTPHFNATVGIDATKRLAKKFAAMEAYESELREYPHPRSSLGIQYHAKTFGMQFGLEAAEPFQLIYDRTI
jgi:LmbE family N-acetylglucosaminyl deacetylase